MGVFSLFTNVSARQTAITALKNSKRGIKRHFRDITLALAAKVTMFYAQILKLWKTDGTLAKCTGDRCQRLSLRLSHVWQIST